MKVLENQTDVRAAIDAIKAGEADVVYVYPEDGVTHIICKDEATFQLVGNLFPEGTDFSTSEFDLLPAYTIIEEWAMIDLFEDVDLGEELPDWLAELATVEEEPVQHNTPPAHKAEAIPTWVMALKPAGA